MNQYKFSRLDFLLKTNAQIFISCCNAEYYFYLLTSTLLLFFFLLHLLIFSPLLALSCLNHWLSAPSHRAYLLRLAFAWGCSSFPPACLCVSFSLAIPTQSISLFCQSVHFSPSLFVTRISNHLCFCLCAKSSA